MTLIEVLLVCISWKDETLRQQGKKANLMESAPGAVLHKVPQGVQKACAPPGHSGITEGPQMLVRPLL